MTKQELLKLHPQAYAFQNFFGLWNIWSGSERKVWLGSGETEESAWDKACEESAF
jgi:hypothetical protein